MILRKTLPAKGPSNASTYIASPTPVMDCITKHPSRKVANNMLDSFNNFLHGLKNNQEGCVKRAILGKEPLICRANTDSIMGRNSMFVSYRRASLRVDRHRDETDRAIRVHGEISIEKEPFDAGAA